MPQSSPKTPSRSRPTTRERIYQVTLFNPGIDSPRIKNLQEIYKKLQLSRIATKISGYTRLAEPSANRSLQKSSKGHPNPVEAYRTQCNGKEKTHPKFDPSFGL